MKTKSDAGQNESELGNLLLQKRGISAIALIIALIVLAFLLIAGVWLFIAIKASYTDIVELIAFLLIVFLVPITLKYYRTISIYDRGVAFTTVLKKHSIHYKDLAGIRFLVKQSNYMSNSVIFAFLPIVDDEIKFSISGSFGSVMEIAQVMVRVIQSYPDIQMYGDMMKINAYGTRIVVEENKGIIDKKIKF